MIKWILIAVITLILLFDSCRNDHGRRLALTSNLFVEGKIGTDTVYDGLVRFSDSLNRVLYECNYARGMLNGQRKVYYENGSLAALENYENGALNGWVSIYNKKNQLESAQFFFHDIKAGPSLTYRDRVPRSFRFFSLDNELLFEIKYDSINGQKITDYQKGFIFFNERKLSRMDRADSFGERETEFFAYLIHPPKFRFKYDVVTIGPAFEVLSEIQKFESDKVIAIFSPHLKKNEKAAMRLEVYDSLSHDEFVMFKRLN